MLLLGGCGGTTHVKTTLFILLDETSSFVSSPTIQGVGESGKASPDQMWKNSRDLAAQSISRLKPGDEVCVIGIDEHGFDDSDVRVRFTPIPKTMYGSLSTKKQVYDALESLDVRSTSSGFLEPNGHYKGKPFGTDQMGALAQAAHFASTSHATHVKVILFSDMQDTPLTNGISSNPDQFPDDTTFLAMNVVQNGQSDFQTVENKWIDKLSILNLHLSKDNFLAPGDSTPEAITSFLKNN